MKLIFFDSALNYPAQTGQKIRNHQMLLALSRCFDEVFYLTFVSEDFGIEDERAVSKFFEDLGISLIVFRRFSKHRFFNLCRGMLGAKPFTLYRYFDHKVAALLRTIISEVQPDVIHSGGYLTSQYFARYSGSALLGWDWHNVESEVLQRYAQDHSSPLVSAYARRTAQKARVYESWLSQFFQIHFVTTERDRLSVKLNCSGVEPVVIPNGCEMNERFDPMTEKDLQEIRMVFVGDLAYHANDRGLRHFIEQIYKTLCQEQGRLSLMIIGPNPTPQLRALVDSMQSVFLTGKVDCVIPYYRKSNVAVAPLLVGGGSRLKIIEAMAYGRIVFATKVGCEGLDIIPFKHYFPCDSIDDYRSALVCMRKNPERALRMAQDAKRWARSNHDWSVITKIAGESYGERLRNHEGLERGVH